MTSFQQFTAETLQDMPHDFIRFNQLTVIIDNQQMNVSKPVYLSIDESARSNRLSDVCIDQESDTGMIKHIAFFYNRYSYTKAFRKMLDDLDNLNYFRLYIEGNNLHNNQINITICFYIKKTYLLELYERASIPLMIYQLIIDKTSVLSEKGTVAFTECENFPNITFDLDLKRNLYDYQVQNLAWMNDIETKVDQDSLTYNLLNKPDNSIIYNIHSIQEQLLLDKNLKTMIDINTLETTPIKLLGGVLSDDVGLGKTFSTIALIKHRLVPDANPSVILCPKRLCLQWVSEIEKSTNLKLYVIHSITHFKKINIDNIGNFDVIILSYDFLVNKRYLIYEQQNSNVDNVFLIKTYNWKRVILDEGHEYVTSGTNLNKMQYRESLSKLYEIKSDYRWICSGTPFGNNHDFWEIIRFLSERSYNVFLEADTQDCVKTYVRNYNYNFHVKYNYAIKNLLQMAFRKNTRDSVNNQINIPEYNLDTELLNMTNIERAIYNSALENKEKKIQLCNHVLVSEHHINILGNEPISMDEAHKKMVEYYDKKIKYQNTRLENIGTELETLEHPRDETKINDLTDKKNTIELELNDNIRKKLIFDELEENLKKEESCPVCYDELTNLYKAATPCGHFICGDCIQQICNHSNRLDCPMCRTPLDKTQLQIISPETMDLTNRLGTKMTRLIEYSKDIISLDADNRIIIFSQWDSMLKLISKNLKNNDVNHLTLNGSYNTINSKLRKFKLDSSIRILLLSSDKAASGLNLTEANHIILMDTLNNDPDTSKIIESQAIGRAVRIGQTKNVQVKRFIMANTIEEEFYNKYISIN